MSCQRNSKIVNIPANSPNRACKELSKRPNEDKLIVQKSVNLVLTDTTKFMHTTRSSTVEKKRRNVFSLPMMGKKWPMDVSSRRSALRHVRLPYPFYRQRRPPQKQCPPPRRFPQRPSLHFVYFLFNVSVHLSSVLVLKLFPPPPQSERAGWSIFVSRRPDLPFDVLMFIESPRKS